MVKIAHNHIDWNTIQSFYLNTICLYNIIAASSADVMSVCVENKMFNYFNPLSGNVPSLLFYSVYS